MGRRRCPICASTKWHKEPSTGLVICSEGHVLQNYRNETNEMTEVGPHTMHRRNLKSGRVKAEKKSKANPTFYHGARARFHYFQCLQLLLRKQTVALIKRWELPSEFEILVRDIWALHISLLPMSVSPEPYLHRQQLEGESVAPATEERRGDKGTKDGNSNTLYSASSSSSSEDENSGGDDDGDDDDHSGLERDEGLEELMRENSDFGSSSEDESDVEKETLAAVTNEGRHKSTFGPYEGPTSNIAVLAVALWTLRIPFIYTDIIRLIERYELPYFDPVRFLPESLADHLNKQTIRALSPIYAPTPRVIHALASRLSRKMLRSYGISTAECNAAPVLWRTVRAMGGTPTLYALAKQLGPVLSLPLTLHSSLAPPLERHGPRDPERHKFDNVPPEVALIATVIIVLKAAYGLDGKGERRPADNNSPFCGLPKARELLQLLRKMNAEEAESIDLLYNPRTAMNVGNFNEEMLDEYLDFCERALLNPNVGPSKGKEDEDALVNRLFPLSRDEGVGGHPLKPSTSAQSAMEDHSYGSGSSAAAATELSANLPDGGTAAATASMEPRETSTMHPGESYTLFHARDVLGTLPEEFEIVLERAARWVGVDTVFLGTVVEYFEWRIVAMERRYHQRSRSRSRSRHASGGKRKKKGGRSTSSTAGGAGASRRHRRAGSRSRSRKATDDGDDDDDESDI